MNYYNNCVGWDTHDVHCEGGLIDMIDNSRKITRQVFVKNVNKEEMCNIEFDLGYGSWLKMKDDYHVSYHKSKLHGEKVYYFRHSAIEYVFKGEENEY